MVKNFLSVLLVLCASMTSQAQVDWEAFGAYWYDGKAEISSYDLKQSRYGEIHEGDAVLVFVTEPFSRSKQVKLDNPASAKSDEVTVMKLNFTKKFVTGIYPYSMMTSSFVPVSYDQYPDCLKVTCSVQEWCGQTFTQLNLEGTDYQVEGYSYFEKEGDAGKRMEVEYLEDELWQKIRLNPELLPTGDFSIFPATMYQRLAHRQLVPVPAKGRLQQNITSEFSEGIHQVYHLSMDERRMKIYIESDFPFQILGWTETYQGSTTTATRKKTIKTAYWRQNRKKDMYLREQLELPTQSSPPGN